MDKLYSKISFIIKAVFCVFLAPLCLLLTDFSAVEDGLIYVILNVLLVGCIYTTPFWVSLGYLKKYRVESVKRYVLWDAVSCLIPAIIGVLFYDIAYILINGSNVASGIVTVIFSFVFVLISSLFWLIYLILSKMK